MARQRIVIQPVGFESPIRKAALELKRYLPKLADVTVVTRQQLAGVPERCAAQIIVGTCEHLGDQGLGALPKPHPLDDALAIIPKPGRLHLVGNNPRSALYAAYRLIEELGVVFLRPGPGEDSLPKRQARLALPVKAIRETASYRHRGICIEGSPRLDHVLDILEWMAKKKMNSFQLQFLHAGTFWKRGYTGTRQEGRTPELDAGMRARELGETDCYALDDRVIAHMRDLEILLHRVGHGWTAAALGYSGGIGWVQASESEITSQKQALMAELGGTRSLCGGMPINTELCYSNPAAREALYDAVLGYAREHSEVDYLHIWLSDAPNNFCECQTCRTKLPIDWYITLINEIGRRMKVDVPKMRIVFIAYHDLLWPPVEGKLEVDNVILMFAPITRCFRHALTDAKCDDGRDWPHPKLNHLELPNRNRPLAELARNWGSAAAPDSFIFDYYMWKAVWSDGHGYDLGETMARDMRNLKSLGLNGLISCQNIRSFYPFPYLSAAMADVLWNREMPLAAHRRKIMSAAFGRHATKVETCFARLIRQFRVAGRSRHESALTPLLPKHRDRLRRIDAFAEEAGVEFAKAARKEKDATVKISLELFAMHLRNTALVVRIAVAGIDGEQDRIAKLYADFEAKQPALLRKYSHWVDPLMSWPVTQAADQARRVASRQS